MSTTTEEAALRSVREQLLEAIAAPKCHGCECFHKTVEALSGADAANDVLGETLSEARSAFQPQQYDCLGCPICYPAIAANAFAEAFPEEGSGMDLCPAEEAKARSGWPPLPGEYKVIRYNAPVAVCTLNSEGLAVHLGEMAPEGLAIAGTLRTENLGIERIIRNTLSNPNIRFLILCGEDTNQAVGHLPGQSLESLFEKGIDERFRIRGALGRRPVLKNVTAEQVGAFVKQVALRPLIGIRDDVVILRAIQECAIRTPGAFQDEPADNHPSAIEASESHLLTLDPAGYFVIYPDRQRNQLAAEHYTNAGVLNCIVEGRTPEAICATIIERQLVSRLDHAAYLGRELAKAGRSLETGTAYVQDRAPGEILGAPAGTSCGCPGSCGDGE